MDNKFEERNKNLRHVDMMDFIDIHQQNKLLLRKKQIDKQINLKRFSGRRFENCTFSDLMDVENFNNFLKNPMNDKTYDFLLTIDIMEKIVKYLDEGNGIDKIERVYDFVYYNLIRLAIREEYSKDSIIKMVIVYNTGSFV